MEREWIIPLNPFRLEKDHLIWNNKTIIKFYCKISIYKRNINFIPSKW